jgi:hypothetical protein
MARPADPQRVFAAGKAATIERLVDYGIQRDWVERWVAEYEIREDILEVRWAATYWDDAYEHVIKQYVTGHQPPHHPES